MTIGYRTKRRQPVDMFKYNQVVYRAAAFGNERVLQSALDAYSHLLDAPDCNGNVPLHAASRKGNCAIVEMLIHAGSTSIDRANRVGQTPMHLAIAYSHVKVMMILIQMGASKVAPGGTTPFWIVAAKNANPRIIEVLYRWEFPGLSSPGENALGAAARWHNYRVVDRICNHVEARPSHFRTSGMITAVLENWPDSNIPDLIRVIWRLIDLGCLDLIGRSAICILMALRRFYSYELVSTLMLHGVMSGGRVEMLPYVWKESVICDARICNIAIRCTYTDVDWNLAQIFSGMRELIGKIRMLLAVGARPPAGWVHYQLHQGRMYPVVLRNQYNSEEPYVEERDYLRVLRAYVTEEEELNVRYNVFFAPSLTYLLLCDIRWIGRE